MSDPVFEPVDHPVLPERSWGFALATVSVVVIAPMVLFALFRPFLT